MTIRYVRKYQITESTPKLQDCLYSGDWLFDRSDFENHLERGCFKAQHWPQSLPDDLCESDLQYPRRHRLQYIWKDDLPLLSVISCNPSKANKRVLDETMHVTVNQAKLWGYGGIDQCNVSPVYETNSHKVHETMVLNDCDNWKAIASIMTNPVVWLAWGSIPKGLKGTGRANWNRAVDKILQLVYKRQNQENANMQALVSKLNKDKKSPAHLNPRRFPRTQRPALYTTPCIVQVQLRPAPSK